MVPRLQLHDVLKTLTEHVYFQPPSNIQLEYPCIIYERNGSDGGHADNVRYRHAKQYQVMVIDRNPDSDLSDEVENLPMCSFQRFFAAENLNHFVFNLFF